VVITLPSCGCGQWPVASCGLGLVKRAMDLSSDVLPLRPRTAQRIAHPRYNYRDIEAMVLVSDYPGGFAVFHGGFGRMHLFALEQRDQLLRRISEHANNYLGIQLGVRKKTITLDMFRENRLGRFANDIAITSLSEFFVNKVCWFEEFPVLSFSLSFLSLFLSFYSFYVVCVWIVFFILILRIWSHHVLNMITPSPPCDSTPFTLRPPPPPP
jgi:hypothetical protein